MLKLLLSISFSVFLISNNSFGQVSFAGYLVDKDNKKMKGVSVKLYEGNELVSTKKWSYKFNYELKLETYYTMELEKSGFITKRIAISTFEGDKGAEPFMFVMELIEKKDAIEDVDSDFPSALIEYKKDEGEFDFDEKYAKNLKKEQKEALKKKKDFSTD